nr:MAG TPA: hypothetical protein [Caudoviricetes sp.]
MQFEFFISFLFELLRALSFCNIQLLLKIGLIEFYISYEILIQLFLSCLSKALDLI